MKNTYHILVIIKKYAHIFILFLLIRLGRLTSTPHMLYLEIHGDTDGGKSCTHTGSYPRVFHCITPEHL